MFIEIATSLLVLIGAAFMLIGSIGLARLPDAFARLHGPTKATTLGVGAIVLASLVHASADAGELSLKALAISVFLFITAPVSASLIAKTALKQQRKERDNGASSSADLKFDTE